MKKVLLVFILTLILTGCTIAKKIDFDDFDEVKYLKENKDNIESVMVSKTTLGGRDCHNLDIEEAYNAFANIEKAKESNLSVTDYYITYIFKFNNGDQKYFSFEYNYFKYNNKSYTLDGFSHLLGTEDSLIECPN